VGIGTSIFMIAVGAILYFAVNADVSRQAAVVGLVHFAAVSGAFVLAEGIETKAEQVMVQRLGVTLGQGYHLGRPASVEAWTRHPVITPTVRPTNVISILKEA